MEILPLTGKMNTLKPHAAKNAPQRALKGPPVCVNFVFFDGVCVLCSVLPCCEGEVGTAGWLKLFSSVCESSGGDWGGSCPGVNWREGETNMAVPLGRSQKKNSFSVESTEIYKLIP